MHLFAKCGPTRAGFLAVVALTGIGSAEASFIVDFETVPGGTPSEGLAINSQYAATTGMTFSVLGGGSPLLVETGGPQTGFQGAGGLPDTMAPGQGTGSFYLSDNGLVSDAPLPLIVSFANPVGLAGGAILDLDGFEAWRIEAYEATNSLLESIEMTTSSLNAGDGLAANWSFARAQNDISWLQFVYTGGTQWAVGFGMDNFSSGFVGSLNEAHAPLPSSLALLISGCLSAIVPVWRKRRMVVGDPAVDAI